MILLVMKLQWQQMLAAYMLLLRVSTCPRRRHCDHQLKLSSTYSPRQRRVPRIRAVYRRGIVLAAMASHTVKQLREAAREMRRPRPTLGQTTTRGALQTVAENLASCLRLKLLLPSMQWLLRGHFSTVQ